MKIATYNIWNNERGWSERLEQIYDEIQKQNAEEFWGRNSGDGPWNSGDGPWNSGDGLIIP
jgi:hypothetical protein